MDANAGHTIFTPHTLKSGFPFLGFSFYSINFNSEAILIEFKIAGRVPTKLEIKGKEVVVYEERWFDCIYDPKTKIANYLRRGGELGAELVLTDVVRAELTK